MMEPMTGRNAHMLAEQDGRGGARSAPRFASSTQRFNTANTWLASNALPGKLAATSVGQDGQA